MNPKPRMASSFFVAIVASCAEACGVSLGPDTSPVDAIVVEADHMIAADSVMSRDSDSGGDAWDQDATDAEIVTQIPIRLTLLNIGPVLFAQYPNDARWIAQAEFFGPTTGSRSTRFSGCYLERVRGRAQMLTPQSTQITLNARVYSLLGGSIGWFYSEPNGVPLVPGSRGMFAVRGGNIGTIDAELTVPSPPMMTAPVGTGSLGVVAYQPAESLMIRWIAEDDGEVVLRLRVFTLDEQIALRCFVRRSVGMFEIGPAYWHALGDAAEVDFAFSGIIRGSVNGVELEGRNINAQRRFRRQP